MQFDTSGLQLQSIAGNSGKAFKGLRSDGTPVFVKYEMPPIVTALAREQITPPVISTNREVGFGNRVEQEWLTGRTLERQDMSSKQVRQILVRLHYSRILLNQALQLNYSYQSPRDLVEKWQKEAPARLSKNTYLQSICRELLANLPAFHQEVATFVHGDLHHKNWVETTSGLVYLTDWETACVTDRMMDVAYLLTHYVPRQAWKEWLKSYGYKYNKTVLAKVYWYGQLGYLNQITKHVESYNMEAANKEIYALRMFKEGYVIEDES
ncbi:TPA: phosphotransferase family protein [Streptococcus suis]|uniref:Phosphotransferase family protein n=1 Tax=Streptococcus suivaginalis TaxID=3028082 RepID=A0AA96VSP4_9STRE|nr:phosphotransferase family protein [Streptococcus sp. 29896]MCK4026873.1 phosphotransferase family protein [Streptococcus suis]NQG97843.1 phosphotransferase family protein [Streptococcus suis]WNY47475.1 phosphotransferase family protein [Streptococcus sp. 29896]HEL1587303.1 phosphotransferase family protein [Streptococcus suis]HEL2057970.1 phosphotransferase family protein [Streptococcus suis]